MVTYTTVTAALYDGVGSLDPTDSYKTGFFLTIHANQGCPYNPCFLVFKYKDTKGGSAATNMSPNPKTILLR